MATAELPPVMVAPGLLGNDTICYPMTTVTTNGIWVGENPLVFAFPIFLLQNLILVITTRLLMFLLKPVNTTHTVCELLCGILYGSKFFSDVHIFQKKSLFILETIGNIGVIYFLFIVGLEMDVSVIKKHGKKLIFLAVAGMFLPFLTACAFSLVLFKLTVLRQATFILLFASALSITSLPVLVRTLGQFRLLKMELGDLAKSTALISEILGVALLVLAISFAEVPSSPYLTWLWIVLSAAAFVVFCLLVVCPAITWLITSRKLREDQGFGNLTSSVLIAGAMLLSAVTDVIGVHPTFGAFVFGLVVPQGALSVTLVEQLEDFVTGLMLPLFFITAGMKTNVAKIGGVGMWVMLIITIVLGSVGKVAGTVLIAQSMKMPLSEGVVLGLLMNTKGLIILLGLNYGKDQKVIDDTSYAIMVITTLIINSLVTPVLIRIYKLARKPIPYSCRTVQQVNADSELRILTCIDNPRNVPTIINLLEASHPTKMSPITAFSLHLVEQTSHGASLVISHGNASDEAEVPAVVSRVQAQTEDIVNAFDAFESNYSGVVEVQAMTGVSVYSVMHKQICNVAEDKRVSLIIVPFHKQQTVDGRMETANPKFRNVNRNVLQNSPCSVGILVDRGLRGTTCNNAQGSHNIGVLFFGGPDDREALSFAVRMSEHPCNTLNVIRFIPGPDAIDPEMDHNQAMKEFGMLSIKMNKERERELDDEYIKDLNMMKLNDESFSYIEKEVNNGDETIAAIQSVESIHDLFIVGRSEEVISSAKSGLTEWSECPELGVIGDLLASADFAATVSVLVMQQYTGIGPKDDRIGMPNTSYQEEQYILGSNR